MNNTPELCKIPKFINFQFHEDQQLITTILLENQIDKVITFKIMSNKPELYLVKPMEGSIYKKESIKITFKRKVLSREYFENYILNPATIQEKFKIEIKSVEKDMIGIDREVKQYGLILAKFNQEVIGAPQNAAENVHEKKVKSLMELKERIACKANEFSRLISEESKLSQQISQPQESLSMTKENVFALIILFFIVGLAFGK